MSAQLENLWHCREMKRTDLSKVLELENESYEFPWTEGIFRDCLRMGYSSWVVTDKFGELLGYTLMSVAADEAHILNLCVKTRHRTQGLGRYILEHLLAEARRHAVVHMILEVRCSNQAAIRLYHSAGFQEIGRRRGYYPASFGREDALVLLRHP